MQCKICGVPLKADSPCPFDVPESKAPWHGDYHAIARGEMTHLQHQISVARWVLHNPEGHSSKAVKQLEAVASKHSGDSIPLFPLDSG